ncbi:MAG: T9SS type A sorting domain-containing protein [Bacteroidota bacterium]
MRKRLFTIIMPLLFLTFNTNTIFGQIVMTNEGTMTIKDDQLVYVNGHFVNKSTFFSNRGDFNLTGNFWNEAKVSNPGYGILRFVGNEDQTYYLYDTMEVFSLEINNPAGLTLTGGNNVRIFSDMNFEDGIVFTNSSSLLAFQENTFHFNAGDNSYADGPVTKTGTSDFIFPVGKAGSWRPSGIQNITEPSTFISEYFNYSYFDLNSDETVYRVSNGEFWEINPIDGDDPLARVILSYKQGIGGLLEPERVRMVHYDSPWTLVESTNNDLTASPAYFRSDFQREKFGLFTFAESELEQPAITFEAFQNEDCALELSWIVPPSTYAEVFEIEVSTDSINYSKIGEEQGDTIPFASFKIFQFYDYELYETERLYYRIKIIQPGGAYYYTRTISVENKCIFIDCSVFPNPVKSSKDIKLSMYSEFEQTLTLRVFDVPGRVLHAQEVEIQPGNQIYPIQTASLNLASGMYFLQITPRKSIKFVVIYD